MSPPRPFWKNQRRRYIVKPIRIGNERGRSYLYPLGTFAFREMIYTKTPARTVANTKAILPVIQLPKATGT
jgi:hypothetical protein